MRRLVARLPVWVQEGPIGTMCVLLGVPAGLFTLFGPARSHALDVALPFWARPLWSICLIVGCIAWAAGLTSVRQHGGILIIGRLPAYILGLQLIATAAIVFGLAIVWVGGWAGVLAAWPLGVVAFGTAVEAAKLGNRYADRP